VTLGLATQDFAFGSGATKSPPIPDRKLLWPPPCGVLRFVFGPNCEMKGRQFAAGDTNVDTGGEFIFRSARGLREDQGERE
jgi:hypothetical protein